MQTLRTEMEAYYGAVRMSPDRISDNVAYQQGKRDLWNAMDAYVAAAPSTPPCLLKARLLEEIAERFDPVLFRHSPFYFEMGVRPAESWGEPTAHLWSEWMLARRRHLCSDLPEAARIAELFQWNPASTAKLWLLWGAFDNDHHSLGYTRILEVGVNGLLSEIAGRRQTEATPAQADFLEAAERSCRALLRIAERFGQKAEALLATEDDPRAQDFLTRIARTVRRVPAEPPRTFYEGLAAVLFLREAVASLECIGISVLGHLDRILGSLYEADIAAGRLTADEAADLLVRWMLHTDIRFHVEDNPWPETSTCIELGGCDADGRPVYNALTDLIIDTHQRWNLINPKLNCRFSAKAPAAYLTRLARCTLAGHNHIALLNDDILIPALVRSGHEERDARLYVNGGCQEPIVEGFEHSAGAYYYFNMARELDLCLLPLDPPVANPAVPRPLPQADTFEEFYAGFMRELKSTIAYGADWLRALGKRWPQVQCCPLFSTTLEGCVASATDYTAGGAKYNPSGIALVGLSTVVDALHAVRVAVYDEKWLTLADLRHALAANWQGHQSLQLRLIRLAKWGHGDLAVDTLAARFMAELAAFVRTIENERGGHYQPSFFVYYMFAHMGAVTRATPDGRRDADLLSQGIAPGRERPPDSLASICQSISRCDFRDFPANAVLDVQLPTGAGMTASRLADAIRAFATVGGPTLQLNAVSVEDMKDAKAHPERHRDLTVRISGLSARFVALTPAVQDELISRAQLS